MIDKCNILTPAQFLSAGIPTIAIAYGIGRYAYGLFLPSFIVEFNLSATTAGFISALTTIIYTFLAVTSVLCANRLRPIYLIVLGSISMVLGILLVSIAETTLAFSVGIILTASGAGIIPPAYLEIIGNWIKKTERNFTTVLLNTSGAPGLAISAVCVYYYSDNWRSAWFFFFLFSLAIILINIHFIPWQKFSNNNIKPVMLRNLSDLLPKGFVRLFLFSFVYGFVINIYYVFSVTNLSYFSESFDYKIIFWFVVGISGIIAAITNSVVERIGVYSALACSFLILSMVNVLLLTENFYYIIFSGFLFGIFSIVPNSACLIWSNQLYSTRLSLGWGVVFVNMSLGMALGPFLAGIVVDQLGFKLMFLSVSVLCLLTVVASGKLLFKS